MIMSKRRVGNTTAPGISRNRGGGRCLGREVGDLLSPRSWEGYHSFQNSNLQDLPISSGNNNFSLSLCLSEPLMVGSPARGQLHPLGPSSLVSMCPDLSGHQCRRHFTGVSPSLIGDRKDSGPPSVSTPFTEGRGTQSRCSRHESPCHQRRLARWRQSP